VGNAFGDTSRDTSWKLFASLLRPHRRAIAIYALFLAIATALPLLAAIVLQRFVNAATRRAPTRELAVLAAIYALLGLITAAFTVAVVWRATALAWRITDGVRHDLAEQVLASDLSFHRDHTRGDLVSRADDDVSSMAIFLAQFVARTIGIGVLALASTVTLAFLQPILAGPFFVGMVMVLAVLWTQRNGALVEAMEEREAKAKVSGLIEERIAGADDIVTLGAGAHSVGKLAERSERVVRATRLRAGVQMRVNGTVKVSLVLCELLMLTWGGFLLHRGAINIGAVVLGVRFASAIRSPVEHLTWRLQEVQGATGSATRILGLMKLRKTYPERIARLPSGPLALHFNDVSLTYDDGDDSVLSHVTLCVHEGRSLGLVGKSGSGKTSLGRLALRLLEPTAGSVVLGGVDMQVLDEVDLRDRVTSIPQDVQLFPGSVRENVTMFSAHSDKLVVAALKSVGLDGWLEDQPDGLNAQLLARHGGSGLSAGEAQLIALARALVRNPHVVVLDEATSRIDPVTQERIQKATSQLLKGRTSIVIAHRLETLSICDDIAVLEDGCVVEFGPREELAANAESRFARLLKSSLAEDVLEDGLDSLLGNSGQRNHSSPGSHIGSTADSNVGSSHGGAL
jgi:ATP-binding cassette, subfamily B, bacterial